MVFVRAPNLANPRKKSTRFRQFVVAGARHGLYHSEKASQRVPRQEPIAITRAIFLVAMTGGVVWYLLWKLATSVWGKL